MIPALMYGSSYPPSAAELLSRIGGVIGKVPLVALVSHVFGSAGVCMSGVSMVSLWYAWGLSTAIIVGGACLSCS